MTPKIDSFARVLAERAALQGEEVAYRYLVDGDVDGRVEVWTWRDLDAHARRVGARLAADGLEGERVLLLFDQGLPFLAAFFGCLYAGAIAVPTSTPDPTRLDRTCARLVHVATDSGARAVLTNQLIAQLAGPLAALAPSVASLPWVVVDAPLADDPSFAPRVAATHDVAFLQYTSGSTGDPRGVIVTQTCSRTWRRSPARSRTIRATS